METILIVDDQKFDRVLAVEILNEGGYHTLEAKDGEEALNICANAKQKIDLVFTDIKMPKMSGVELAKTLRSRSPEIKVLFTSGCYLPQEFKPAIPDKLFIEKGYTDAVLFQKIRQVLTQ